MSKSSMPDHQRKAYEKALEILSEHFDTVVLAVDSEHGSLSSFRGSYVAAFGLANLMVRSLERMSDDYDSEDAEEGNETV